MILDYKVTKFVSIEMVQIIFFKASEGGNNESSVLTYFFSSSASSFSLASYSSSSINYTNIKANILNHNHNKSGKRTNGNQRWYNRPDVEPRPLLAADKPLLQNQHPSLQVKKR